MISQNKSHPVVDRMIEMFGDWLIHRRAILEMEEICNQSAAEFSRIASDLGITPDTLDAFVRKGPHAADELPKLLDTLGIDDTDIARTQPQLLLDMQRVCAFCRRKGECNRDLDAHIAAENYEKYCENSDAIRLLKSHL